MLKKPVISLVFVMFISLSVRVFAAEKGQDMLFIVTSPDAQTQMMSMVLSTQSFKKGANVSILFCGPGADITLKGSKETKFKPIDKSPQMLLKGLVENGVSVQICPLYLPSKDLTIDALIPGVTQANPSAIADQMIQPGTKISTF
ncbi:DsrE family protein [Desulfopila aestuarii]|uniref:Intracellular sulfur oxidation protein, DsrE/DsrF family n=1 Tax=Desulfopila aestuarii DSM 18488 TaxID=1121416 RepID=A0A1M7YH58_9BACT|nr:DsrE family protein [Desulfopila aestuarii]SHO51919.1 Intracellular sulfur oxidation protein, DsrE/DsrF family [Desulfopila aestuarii DSM 18488]